MNPFRRRALTPEFLAAWAEFEAANKAAAEQYKTLPTSFNRAGFTAACSGCGKTTTNPGGTCRECRKAGTS